MNQRVEGVQRAAREEIGALLELLNQPDVLAAARGYLVVRDPLELVSWLADPVALDQAEMAIEEDPADFQAPSHATDPLPPTTLSQSIAAANPGRWENNPDAGRFGLGGGRPTGTTRTISPVGRPPGEQAAQHHMSEVQNGPALASPLGTGYGAQANGVPPHPPGVMPRPLPAAVPPLPPGVGADDPLGRALSRYFGG